MTNQQHIFELREMASQFLSPGSESKKMFEDIANTLEAAEVLSKRLHFIHTDPAYRGVWEYAHFRLGAYGGPKYDAELANLDGLLNP